MLHKLGTKLISTYNDKLRGPIVGYGTLTWPTEDDYGPRVVYLIQIAEASSSLGPAVAVLSSDNVRKEI